MWKYWKKDYSIYFKWFRNKNKKLNLFLYTPKFFYRIEKNNRGIIFITNTIRYEIH